MTKLNASDMTHVDIAIVGAGMVGAALALALKDCPFTVALVDGQSDDALQAEILPAGSVAQFDTRVSALTMASQRLLQALGAWQNLAQANIMPFQKMSVWDELGTAQIDFDAAELYCNELGFIVANQNVVAALHRCLTTQGNLTRLLGCDVKRLKSPSVAALRTAEIEGRSAGNELTLSNGQRLHCNLVVAADGANSKIRALAGIATREWDYEHHAIVATVETELAHGRVARQQFSESGPLAFLPLQDAHSTEKFCSIVWSLKPALAETMMALNDQQFAQAAAAGIDTRLGRILQVSKRQCYPLRQRHAKSYIAPGIVLIGDAAHTIHPLAGQGVNLGFKDAQALGNILQEAGKLRLAADNRVLLQRYQRQRKGDNLLMMGLMEGFKQLFEQPDPLVRWVRNVGLDWVGKQTLIKNQIVRHAMGLNR